MRDDNINRNMILNECLEALGLVLEYDLNDFHTHQHATRVGEGCVLIGDRIGLDSKNIQKMYYAGLLHDIGKIAVDLKLLSKKERLSDEEFEVIKKHAVYGSRILAPLPELNDVALWVRWHHERWDGTGYPDSLHGNEIPIEVQILSAVDCLDSLQTPRLDRERLTPDEAYKVIENDRGTYFNPEILNLVLDMVNNYELIPGQSSDKFLNLKEKYVNIPLTTDIYGQWEGYGMTSIYPIARLFAKVIDAKHHYTAGHSIRVSVLSKYLALKMNLETKDIIQVEIAGLLHDAGKVSVPVEILDKNGDPDEMEWKFIKGHPTHSFDILKNIASLKDIAEIVAHHHERLDGKGYPKNIKGDEIPLLSQIITVADTFDAITSTRTYREGRSPEEAYKIIKEELGTQLNSEAGSILLETQPKYIKAIFDMHEEHGHV